MFCFAISIQVKIPLTNVKNVTVFTLNGKINFQERYQEIIPYIAPNKKGYQG